MALWDGDYSSRRTSARSRSSSLSCATHRRYGNDRSRAETARDRSDEPEEARPWAIENAQEEADDEGRHDEADERVAREEHVLDR